ncbi:zinc ABC transporter substrate-binding protein [Ruegeria sp.]|uniref:zinc ABC transporter substrate-binding protein n=1 Tax=Ruegeria sp. TaxID=1879320 RepID=UPI0023144256|nr:zinc ABC transporter substrate-binding protein [Ruegeria sp.]MDA7966309.1 zinc ABC transporter substrate-binding protein [Ruegeria sp.]
MSRKLLPISITAALMGGTALAEVPNVATDIAPVHSLVARVMDGVGTPDLIVQPGASPHEYNLRPSEAAALQDADLVFWMGEDLTPWMHDAIETLAGEAAVTSLLEADGTVLLDFREGALFEAHAHGEDDGHDDAQEDGHDHDDHAEDEAGHDHDDHAGEEDKAQDDHDHGDEGHDDHADEDGHDHDDHAEEDSHDHEDHAEGDAHGHEEEAGHSDDHGDEDHAGHDHDAHGHGAHDPHAWLSLDNAETWLNVIAAQLSAADPDNAGAYYANAAAARAEMEALSAEVSATLDPVRGGSFIVFHDAYQYFEDTFDFPASGAISLSDASDPGPARVAEIQGRIREEGVDCVLTEPQFNPGLVSTVLDGTEAKTGVIDPLGAELEPGVDLYPQLIRNMAKTLAGCL